MVKDNCSKCNMYIHTLGKFIISYNDKKLDINNIHSRKVRSLLEYLIINRHNVSSMDKLIDAIWCDEDIDNPAHALKNLIYRLRHVLADHLCIDSNEYITTKNGSYAWNNDSNYTIDIDEFENLIVSVNRYTMNDDEVLKRYQQALKMYDGDFLSEDIDKDMVYSLSIYYQNLYMKAVKCVSEILYNRKDYEKLIELCNNAIEIDKLNEDNHAMLIKALAGQNNYKKALEHYNQLTKMFYDQFGISPSDEIKQLYPLITQRINGYEKNIISIKEDLVENEKVTGALVCNYETFKWIYRLQSRALLRNGKAFYLVLITIKEKANKLEYITNNLESIIEKVIETISISLRKEDVLSRCGKTQFALMLPNITYENVGKVIRRIEKNFNMDTVCRHLLLSTQVSSLDHLEEDKTNDRL